MKANMLFMALVLSVLFSQADAQSSYDLVYNILQTKCAASCHKGGTPDGNLLLDASSAQVYNNLVGVMPDNATAAGKGEKLIDPGYPYRSFLMRKIGHDLDSSLTIEASEGSYMPQSGTITNLEAELIRQWILWGAKDTGALYDAQKVTDYYTLSGNHPSIQRPASPQEEGRNGYQIRIGPFFLAAGEEVEYFKKEEMDYYFDGPVDVVGMKANLNAESHHFALFNLNPTQPYPTSFMPVNGPADQIVIHFNATEVGAWNESLDIPMPTNAAYKWPELTYLVLDYHIFNANPSGILPADAWINVYTEAPDPTREEMTLDFPNFGGFNPFVLQIPPTGQPYTETMIVNDPGSTDTWKLWRMQGHTHSLGTGFKAWLRNPDGTKGDLIYDGNYSFDYSIYQGFYEYDHAPIRKFEPYLELPAKDGLIFEATYLNNTSDTIGFGLTTQDEMFAGYIHYVAVPKTIGIDEVKVYEGLEIAPNPANGIATVKLPADAAENPYAMTVYDLSGRVVFTQAEIRTGKYELDASKLEQGVYLVELQGANTYRSKLMVE